MKMCMSVEEKCIKCAVRAFTALKHLGFNFAEFTYYKLFLEPNPCDKRVATVLTKYWGKVAYCQSAGLFDTADEWPQSSAAASPSSGSCTRERSMVNCLSTWKAWIPALPLYLLSEARVSVSLACSISRCSIWFWQSLMPAVYRGRRSRTCGDNSQRPSPTIPCRKSANYRSHTKVWAVFDAPTNQIK